MPRPRFIRTICHPPLYSYFMPHGTQVSALEEVVLTLDELEAVRLADLEGFYQEDAASKMNISRQTFGRIIDSAHKKLASAIVEGKAIKIQGGEVKVSAAGMYHCYDCHYSWKNSSKANSCPRCGGKNVRLAEEFGRHFHARGQHRRGML